MCTMCKEFINGKCTVCGRSELISQIIEVELTMHSGRSDFKMVVPDLGAIDPNDPIYQTDA